MTFLFILIGIASLVSDSVALYFAFHSRRHERENTVKLNALIRWAAEIDAKDMHATD